MGKPTICKCESKGPDQLRGNHEADQRLCFRFVFAASIVQSLYFLNPKFQASSHVQWLHSPVCVGPGQKPQSWFSHKVAQILSPGAVLTCPICIKTDPRNPPRHQPISSLFHLINSPQWQVRGSSPVLGTCEINHACSTHGTPISAPSIDEFLLTSEK